MEFRIHQTSTSPNAFVLAKNENPTFPEWVVLGVYPSRDTARARMMQYSKSHVGPINRWYYNEHGVCMKSDSAPPQRSPSEPDFLARIGTNGELWAKEFCARNPGIDEDIVRMWFQNAIEAGRSAGWSAAEAKIADQAKQVAERNQRFSGSELD